MGFFDSIKSKIDAAKNYMGEAAHIELVVNPTTPKDTFIEGKIIAKTKNVDFVVEEVQLLLVCEEKVSITLSDSERGTNTEDRDRYNADKDIRKYHKHVNHTFIIAKNQSLKMNTEYSWDFKFDLPNDRIRSFDGYYCKVKWQVAACLKKSGNDPDSDFIEINI